MAPSGNGQIPNSHFHKDWQRYVRTWFTQPFRKQRRRFKRKEKARRVFPRPLGKLKPVVRCPSNRHNTKKRLGKGFTLQELKAAGMCKRYAMTIGIAVDRRRQNKSAASLSDNIQRLKEYKKKLILFPINSSKKSKYNKQELAMAKQLKGTVMPIKKAKVEEKSKHISKKDKRHSVYRTLRRERAHARNWGMRAKKAKEAAEETAVIGKK